jgi:hypothetical protein
VATKGALKRATKKPNIKNVKVGQGGSDKGRHDVSGTPPKGMGGGSGGKKKPGKKPGKKAPSTPSAEVYAQRDPDYRRAIAGYRTNLANLKTQQNANKSDLNTDYATTRDRLLTGFKQNDTNQRSDFAARGMFGSGVYAKAKTDREKEETNQLNDASSSYTRNVRSINTDVANATNLERQQEGTAKAAAIRRAAAQYGLTGRPATAKPKKPGAALGAGGKKHRRA